MIFFVVRDCNSGCMEVIPEGEVINIQEDLQVEVKTHGKEEDPNNIWGEVTGTIVGTMTPQALAHWVTNSHNTPNDGDDNESILLRFMT